MHDDEKYFKLPPSEPPDLETITCQLANGHDLKLEARNWADKPTIEEIQARVLPAQYFAIRIYCTESALPKRLVWCEEFRDGTDFNKTSIAEIWSWLAQLANSRAIFEFDDLEGFLDHVSEGINHLSHHDSLATDHYDALPGLTVPHWFDRIDDSIFNDQNQGD